MIKREPSPYYRERCTKKRVLTAILAVILAFALLFCTLFFAFRKYIVYTDDGLYLEIPWLEIEDEKDIPPAPKG